MCVCVRAHSIMFYSLWPHGLYPTRLLCPWDFPGKNTGVNFHFFPITVHFWRAEWKSSPLFGNISHAIVLWKTFGLFSIFNYGKSKMNILIYATLKNCLIFLSLNTRSRLSGSRNRRLKPLIIITKLPTLTYIFYISFLLGRLGKNVHIWVFTIY